MELFEKIIAFLDENKVEYQLFEHSPVFTSVEAAVVRQDFSLHQGAKAMILKIERAKLKMQNDGLDANFVMCVLPGDKKIDFKKLKKELEAHDVNLASPEEVERIVGVKVGAVSPFGNLSGLKVLLDESIYDNEEIIFNAGDHSKSVKMKLFEYLRIVNPEQLSFSK